MILKRPLSSLAKYRVVGGIGKSGSEAAALQIASSQYHARLGNSLFQFSMRNSG